MKFSGMTFQDYQNYLVETYGKNFIYTIEDYHRTSDMFENAINSGEDTQREAIFGGLYQSDKETFYQILKDYRNLIDYDGCLEYGKVDFQDFFNKYVRAS